MPAIVTESYQIMLGVDANDAAATAVGPTLKDRARAEQKVRELLELKAAGLLEDAVVAGKTFFVKAIAGTVNVTGADAMAAYQEFLASKQALVIYVRTAGGTHIRYGALPAEKLGAPS